MAERRPSDEHRFELRDILSQRRRSPNEHLGRLSSLESADGEDARSGPRRVLQTSPWGDVDRKAHDPRSMATKPTFIDEVFGEEP
jgi:hypothetical protein